MAARGGKLKLDELSVSLGTGAKEQDLAVGNGRKVRFY